MMGKRFSKQRHKPRFTKAQIPWLIRGAIRSNNLETMQYLLSYPNEVNPSMVIDGVCPINLAVELGHVQMVKLLLKAGADIHVADCPRYPLHQACLHGRACIVDILIRSGAKVNVLTERHQSCFHLLATQSGERYLETARILLSHNGNPNSLDDDGQAPLHRACVEMVEVLGSSEITDLNILNQAGDTPLLTAAKDRREAVLLALIRVEFEQQQNAVTEAVTPATISVVTSDIIQRSPLRRRRGLNLLSVNRTPSSKSAGSGASRLTLISSGSLTAAADSPTALLTTSPSHVQEETCDGEGSGWAQRVFRASSAAAIQLHSTAAFIGTGLSKTVGTLKASATTMPVIQNEEEATVGEKNNMTTSSVSLSSLVLLQTAPASPKSPHAAGFQDTGFEEKKSQRLPSTIMLGRQPSMKVMGPRLNLDHCDNVGMTPLMISAEAGQAGLRMVIGLVSAGCDISIIDKMGMTAVHYACYVGAISTVRYLIEEAGAFSEKRPLDLLNLQDRFGRTPICLATCRGHSEVVTYLLSCNADIHSPNKELKSPLYIAANFGHLDIVNAFLRHGAQVNQADSHNKTPLYMATYHGRVDIVELLLAAKANVNAADKNGRTPLYIAVLHGHLALAQKLLASGASVNRPDNEGLGPLHMAVKFPKLDIPMIKLLLSYGCDPVNLASFTRWLLGHGIIPGECIQGDDELAEWLRHEESNVRSLKRLCRTEIQQALGNADSMQAKISYLPLPEHLRTFVSLRAL